MHSVIYHKQDHLVSISVSGVFHIVAESESRGDGSIGRQFHSRAVISIEFETGQCLIAGKDIKFRIEFQIRPSIAA